MGCARINWWRRRESNLNGDPEQLDISHTDPGHNPHNSPHSSELRVEPSQDKEHYPHTPEHKQGRSVHLKGVPAEHRVPDDLKRVIEVWGDLPADIRSAILTMVGPAKDRPPLGGNPPPIKEWHLVVFGRGTPPVQLAAAEFRQLLDRNQHT